MIHELSADECRALLKVASVGRVGFVRNGRVQIIPVNYVLDDHSVIIRTVPGGTISAAVASGSTVAFEVDHLDPLAGAGWSVLMNGAIHAVTDPAEIAAIDTHRVSPWAGPARPLHLRFTPDEISGRHVRRERDS
jgi:nitroimidazol reductase NimA-like FMN-containing flavoprotein (pyridoxamine 5'-phosphate oxidase superfamily)